MQKDEKDKLDADLFEEDYVPEAEDFFDQQEKGEEYKEKPNERPYLKKIVIGILVLALFANVIQFFPRVMNLDVFRFLHTSYELSKDERIEEVKEAIVSIRTDGGNGTGFVIEEQGIIISNHHVVDVPTNLYIHFQNDSFYAAEQIATLKEKDIAVLKINAEHPLKELPTSTSDVVKEGETIYVVGNPLSFSRIANKGTIIGETTSTGIEGPVIMIDAPIYKGNSGSPLLNEKMEVIGVIFATRTTEEFGKVGLAIPLTSVEDFLEENDVGLE